jgi:hypothetical protein
MDREKVIKGLECCAAMSGDECIECPYSKECLDVDLPYGMPHLAADALALLKAQEARVISWQDAESMRLCWVETRFPHTISPADIMHYFAESPNITVFKIHQNAIDWPLDEYGIKWRCWNNEPTNEQMEAVKWE